MGDYEVASVNSTLIDAILIHDNNYIYVVNGTMSRIDIGDSDYVLELKTTTNGPY